MARKKEITEAINSAHHLILNHHLKSEGVNSIDELLLIKKPLKALPFSDLWKEFPFSRSQKGSFTKYLKGRGVCETTMGTPQKIRLTPVGLRQLKQGTNVDGF